MKKKTGLFIALGCGAATLAVVGVLVAFCLVNNVFLSKPKKVMAAAVKTFEKTMLLDELQGFEEITAKNAYTMDMNVKVEGVEFGGTILVDKKDKGVTLEANIDQDDTKVDMSLKALLDKSKLSVQIPELGDTVYSYNYTKIPTGDLFEEVEEEDIEIINGFLKYLYDYEADPEVGKKVQKAFLDELNELEFESVDAEDFQINGKDKKCKGYEVRIKGKNLANIVDNIYEAVGDDYIKELEELAGIAKTEINVDELTDEIDEMKEMLEEMDPIDFTFYLNGNTYAAIVMESDGSKIEIDFLGGKRPTQNMKVKVDGETVLEVKGETEDNEDECKILIEDETILKIRRDNKTKEMKITIYGDEEVSFKCLVKSSRNSAEFKVYGFSAGSETLDASISVKLSQGAKMPKMDGDEFDIGEATKEEFEDIFEKIKDEYEDYTDLL